MSGGFIPDEDLPQGGQRKKTARTRRVKRRYSKEKKTVRRKSLRKSMKKMFMRK
jgi:hypothetical protein